MIIGERIRFRAAEASDLPIFTAWLNDPEVRYGISIFLPMSLDEEQRWYSKVFDRPKEERPFVIEANTPAGWQMIGNCALFDIDWVARGAELGIMIGEKAFWNQGYGTESVRLLCRVGFAQYNLNRVYLRVLRTNPRAVRSYEKAGFQHEGCHRQAVYRDGE